MEAVASIAIIALLLVNALTQRGYEKREAAWATERRELLTRITHPEFIPVPPEKLPPDSEMLTADTDDDYGLVGTVEGGPHLDLVQGDSNGSDAA